MDPLLPLLGDGNYRGFEGLEPAMAATNLAVLARQYFANSGGFRRYVHQQAFLALPITAAGCTTVDPCNSREHLEMSQKVGIRSQLFNRQTQRLEDDFLCLSGCASTHVLNAISPAFTASFELADLILDQAIPKMYLQ